MARRINFDDDIFFVKLRLRNIADGLKLDLDPELFAGLLLGDLRFVDECIRSLYASLTDAKHVVRRHGYLRQLAETQRDFTGVLRGIQGGKSALADQLRQRSDSLSQTADWHGNAGEAIRLQIANEAADGGQEQLVSTEELEHLLVPDDSEG